MMKRITILLLAALLLLSGCVNQVTPTDPEGTWGSIPVMGNNPTTAPTESDAPFVRHVLPETVDNPENLPVLKWVCLVDKTYGNKKNWNPEVLETVNDLLAEKEIPFRLQVDVLYINEYFPDWLSIPEVQDAITEADLLFGFFYPEQMKAYFASITEYATGDDAPLKNSVPIPYFWDLGTVDGEIYGIMTEVVTPKAGGWTCDKLVFSEYGLSPESFVGEVWEMDAVFATLYEKHGQKPFLYMDTGTVTNEMTRIFLPNTISKQLSTRYQRLTACYGIDYAQDHPTVVNLLETEYTRKVLDALHRYKMAGYTSDFSDKGGKTGAMIVYDSVFSDFVYEKEVYQKSTYAIPTGQLYLNGVYGGWTTGIAKNTQQKENAVSLLQLIGDDEEFRRLLCFGREGQEYTNEGGVYVPNAGANGYDLSFTTGMRYFSGLDIGFSVPAVEGQSSLATYRDLAERSNAFCPLEVAIGFDISVLDSEITAVNELLDKNCKKVLDMTESDYENLMTEIRAAGGDKIQAELQRQLDAWLAENPDWNK